MGVLQAVQVLDEAVGSRRDAGGRGRRPGPGGGGPCRLGRGWDCDRVVRVVASPFSGKVCASTGAADDRSVGATKPAETIFQSRRIEKRKFAGPPARRCSDVDRIDVDAPAQLALDPQRAQCGHPLGEEVLQGGACRARPATGRVRGGPAGSCASAPDRRVAGLRDEGFGGTTGRRETRAPSSMAGASARSMAWKERAESRHGGVRQRHRGEAGVVAAWSCWYRGWSGNSVWMSTSPGSSRDRRGRRPASIAGTGARGAKSAA